MACLAGTAFGAVSSMDARALVWLFGAVAAAIAFGWMTALPRLRFAGLACGYAIVGAVLAAHARETALHTSLRDLLESNYGEFAIDALGPQGEHPPVVTRFVLQEDAGRAGDVVLFPASVTGLLIDRRWRRLPGDGVRLTVGGATSDQRLSQWRAGRTIVAPVTFRRPARYLNEGVPDFERALALDGTSLLGTVKSGLLLEVERPGSRIQEVAAAIRLHVRLVIERRIAGHDPVAAAVITAVLIGDRSGLPDSVRTRLQAAGIYHVIAISGGNIAILAGLLLLTLALVGVRGRPAAMATLVLLWACSCVITAGPSVWRATLMAIVYLAARAIDHRTPTWHAMAVAIIAMIVAQPLDVRDPGFILTFGATLALVEVARRAGALTPRTLESRRVRESRSRRAVRAIWRSWIAPSLLASAAVEVALMPVSAVAFSRITVAGLVLNLAAVPAMALVQSAGLVLVLCDHWSVVAVPAAWIATWSATGLVECARLVDVAPWLARRVPPPWPVVVIAYYVGLAVVLAPIRRLRLAGGIVMSAAALVMVCGVSAVGWSRTDANEASLRLTMFDVGQAEAMLLQVPGAGPLLVDAAGAPFGSGLDIGTRVLTPALWAKHVTGVDTLLVTHGDPDHVGGAAAVIEAFTPARLWIGVDVPSHEPTQSLMGRARQAGLVVESLRAGEVRAVGRARLRVLHPPEPDWERPRVRNDDSVVLELLFGDTAFLLTGDISAEVERAILPQLSTARYRILKVAHHGSRTSTSGELLDAWKPQLAIVSCGRGNRFGHPAPEVIARLAAAGVRVVRTDLEGQITIETDGRQVGVTTYAGSRR
ncbi:MAG TPA: DNA internalization-related competence protein ComEC/Rec2 [Vicinamibacterales bacterium]|nr:DNA internalization-related competence protein ComEC/Rec2 [Vicinamibacterales bacterium]